MTVRVTKDGVADLLKAVRQLTKSEVLVGIPDKNAERKPVEGEHDAPANAVIGYIMETGDPEKHIPARPFLLPGIESVKDKIVSDMKQAGLDALSGDVKSIRKHMAKAGTEAASAVQQKITDGPFAPLSERTIEARAARGRKGAKQYLKLRGQGVPKDMLDSAGFVTPLVDTGQLRRAITYVIREKGK